MTTSPETVYWYKFAYILTIGLVLVGALHWLCVGLTGVDCIRLFLGRRRASWIYCAVGVAALVLVFNRDTYLPFLGETIFPGAAVSLKVPQGATESITVHTRPNAKVVYWAANANPTADTVNPPPWYKAYAEFENSGVVQADESGVAVLRIRGQPESYKVPFAGKLEPHVHFREEGETGMFGRVKTYYIHRGVIEGFTGI